MSLETDIETLAKFESWREDTLLSDPDVSLTAYIRVLEAGQPDPRIAEVHAIASATLEDFSELTDKQLEDNVRQIAKLTDTITAEVEVFKF